MQIARRFTRSGHDPFESIEFVPRSSRITNPDGSVVFEATDIMVPKQWSQVAVDILAQKYFRKAGVPHQTIRVPENGVPDWLWRSIPEEGAGNDLPDDARFSGEGDARQDGLVERLLPRTDSGLVALLELADLGAVLLVGRFELG